MTSAIFDHLWQSTLFALAAALLTLALRNNGAHVRYWVWLTASVKFLVPFSLLTALGNQFSWRTAMLPRAADTFATVAQQIAEPLGTPAIVMRAPELSSFSAIPWVIGAWVLVSAALLTRWLLVWFRIKRVAAQATAAQIDAPIAVKFSSVLSEPGVLGILRPVLLLPQGITERLAPAQLQAILAHELCHVRRRDNLTAAVHMVVEVLFWFHPLVWWIGSRMVDERERACDEAVVDLGNERQAYAESILKVCQFYVESKLTCVAGVSGANLKKRVEVIMSNRIVHGVSAAKKWLLTASFTAAIGAPLIAGVVGSSRVLAQASGAHLGSFDEVTIRLGELNNPSLDAATRFPKPGVWMYGNTAGDFTAKNKPLVEFIALAYEVDKSRVVGGPNWIYSLKYDVEAKSRARLNSDGTVLNVEYPQLVQSLLKDRFNLQLHRETRQQSVFVMSIGNPDAVRSSIVPPEEPPRDSPAWLKRGTTIEPDRLGLVFKNAPMSELAKYLSVRLGRPVIDRTGLKGDFNYGLTGKEMLKINQSDLVGTAADPLPAAVEQQLGLKLESQMAPVEVVVIDDARQAVVGTFERNADVGEDRPATVAGSNSIGLLREDIVPADQVAFEDFHKDFGWRAPNESIRDMIAASYHVQMKQIVGGPTWIDTLKYHIAFGGSDLKPVSLEQVTQVAALNRTMLQDRFGLKYHREVRRVPAYVLALSEHGLSRNNFREVSPEESAPLIKMSVVSRDAFPNVMLGTPMQEIASRLSRTLNSVVLDHTGLKGTYNLELHGDSSAANLPALFQSQLGLTLVQQPEAVEVFVIDAISHLQAEATARL